MFVSPSELDRIRATLRRLSADVRVLRQQRQRRRSVGGKGGGGTVSAPQARFIKYVE